MSVTVPVPEFLPSFIQEQDNPALVRCSLEIHEVSAIDREKLLDIAVSAHRKGTVTLLLEEEVNPYKSAWRLADKEMKVLISDEMSRLHPIKVALGFYSEPEDADETFLYGLLMFGVTILHYSK